jgi:hypothetical protein
MPCGVGKASNLKAGTLEQIVKSSGGHNPSLSNQDPKSPGFMLGRVFSALLKTGALGILVRQTWVVPSAALDNLL